MMQMAGRSGAERPGNLERKRKMMSLFMFYEEESQLQLNRLLAAFSEDLKKMGAELRVADFDNI